MVKRTVADAARFAGATPEQVDAAVAGPAG
jgi:hypothetical protein